MGASGDTGFWIAVTLSVLLHVGGGAFYHHLSQGGDHSVIKVQAITAAVLVRKGKPRPKHLLPRIYKDKPRVAPRRRVVVRKRRRPRRRRRRMSTDDLIRRAQERIERMRRRSKRQEDDPRAEYGTKPGQAYGSVDGTAQEAKLGNIYLGRLTSKIEQNMEFPEILSKQQIQRCRQRVKVMMHLSKNGRLRRGHLRILRKSGDHRCDNAVLAAIKRAAPFPAPPNKLWRAVKAGIIIQLATH